MQASQHLILDSSTGWLQGVRHLASDNHNARPSPEISLLVIHNISLPPGQFGTGMVEAYLPTNCLLMHTLILKT